MAWIPQVGPTNWPSSAYFWTLYIMDPSSWRGSPKRCCLPRQKEEETSSRRVFRSQNPDALTTVRSYSAPSSAMLPTVRSLPLFALLFLLALSASSASESDHKVSSLFLPFKIISSSLLVDTSIIPYIFTFFSDRLVATQMQESFHRGSRFSRHFLALIERSLVSFGLVCGYCWD